MKKPIFFIAMANDQVGEHHYLRNLPDELRSIRSSLRRAEREGLCTIVERSNVTIDEIFDIFQDEQYANNIVLFHFAGHADSYHLLLESVDKQKSPAHAEGLVSFLGRQQGLQVVFLNGCSTEKQANDLIEAGIPAVIGTATRIEDKTAKTLAARFYNGLGNGASLIKAWQDAIDDLKTKGGRFYRSAEFEEINSGRFPWELHIREGAENVKTWNLPEVARNPLFGLPPLSSDYFLPEKPFLYLFRFEREHAQIFFGRGAAIRNLFELATSPKSQPIILLHGQSGVGKSSLLEAGLFPRLENSHQIKFQRRDSEIGLVNQFKELIGIEAGTSPKQAWLGLEEKEGKPILAVLDQVEEVFTQPHAEFPDELDQLCILLKDVFYYKKDCPQGKIILSYRKEFHSEINAILKKHELPRNDFFVERLGRTGIIEAVEGLTKTQELRQQYKLTVEANLPEIIADDLLEDRVSAIAPVLQILLTKMWDVNAKLEGNPQFTIVLYQELKKRGYLLSHFLQEKLNELQQWNEEAVNSGLALDLLAFHTTDKGTARQRKVQEVRNQYKGRQELINVLIRKIKGAYLLSDTANDTSTLTLAHDTLAVLVKDKYEKSDLPGPKASRILKNKKGEWLKEKSSALLTEEEVNALIAGRPGMRAWEEEEENMVEECQKHIQQLKQQKRTMSYMIWGLGLAAMLFGLFFGLNYVENERIKRADRLFGEGQMLQAADPTAALEKMQAGWEIQRSQTKLGSILALCRDNLFYNSILYDKASAINLVVFHPSANIFALTKINQNKVYLYERKGSQADSIGCLEGPENPINSLRFSKDGRLLVAGSADRKVHLWDWKQNSHNTLPILTNFRSGHIIKVDIAGDGKTIAATRNDTLLIFDTTSDTLLKSLPIGSNIEGLSFDPNNFSLWIGAANGNLYFLEKHDAPLMVLHSDTSSIKAICTTGTENKVLHLTEKGAYLWNTSESPPQLEKTIGRTSAHLLYTDAACSPDGRLLLTASKDKIARLWNIQTGTLLFSLNGHQQPIMNLGFNASGDTAITVSPSTLLLWKLSQISPVYTLQEDGFSVEAIDISSDGEKLVAGTRKPALDIWDLGKQELVYSEEATHSGRIDAATFAIKPVWAYSGGRSGLFQQWPLIQGQGKTLYQFDNGINAMDANESYILIATGQKEAFLWEVNSSTAPIPLTRHRSRVLSAALSSNKNLGITGGADSLAVLWDIRDRKVIDTFYHQFGEVRALAFFDDDRSFLSIDENSYLHSWNLKSRQHSFRKLKEENVKFLLIDPEGRFYVTASDSRIEIWYNEAPNTLLRQLETPDDDKIRSMAISPDGKWVFSGNRNGKIHAWKNDWLPEFLVD